MNAPHQSSPLLVTAFNGLVAAYDRMNGSTAWTFPVLGKSVPGMRPRPTHVEVLDGRVFVFAGGPNGREAANMGMGAATRSNCRWGAMARGHACQGRLVRGESLFVRHEAVPGRSSGRSTHG